ncbi:hypothetical protein TNCT_118981, partial [Trichonephila clavata]
VQKRGFKDVGNRIESGSVGQSQNIELKDLITKSDGYDEEFVKDVLNVIVEERTTTEKQKVMELEDKQKSCVCGPTTRKRIRTGKVENST